MHSSKNLYTTSVKRKHKRCPAFSLVLMFCYSIATVGFFTYGLNHGRAAEPDVMQEPEVIQEPYVAAQTPTPAIAQPLLQTQEQTPEQASEQQRALAQEQAPENVQTSETVPLWYDGDFELPISGATGYAPIPMNVYNDPNRNPGIVLTLTAGQGFTIIYESGDWWHIQIGEIDGYVRHRSCFINLPDVLPSIVYDITNAYNSVISSAGVDIPNITGRTLYNAMAYNTRLDREVFTVPILYSTAQRLAAAQKAALADGNTIIIYEAFRPRETQQRILDNFRYLVNSNSEVANALGGWGIGSFISTSVSNHQRGAAIDVSLGYVLSQEIGRSGEFGFIRILDYEEHIMPSPIHDLSARSIIFRNSFDTGSDTAWRNAPLADTATDGAILLQNYLADAGFTPIASEWWHFNDLNSLRLTRQYGISGEFLIESNFSIPPNPL